MCRGDRPRRRLDFEPRPAPRGPDALVRDRFRAQHLAVDDRRVHRRLGGAPRSRRPRRGDGLRHRLDARRADRADGQGRAALRIWDGVAIPAAIAASTSRIKIGTWVLSSLHRNPGITAKAAATIDEISGGRFVLGLGAGHAGSGAHAFGLPEDHVYDRFEEALQIVVPLLRQGRADFEGNYHVARDLVQLPPGPRPNAIPIVLAGHGPKGYRHAARLADVWSCYAEEASAVSELGPRVAAFEEACAEVGRDPGSVGRSAGVVVAPLEPAGATGMFGAMIGGSAEQIADALRPFRAAGFTQLELLLHPQYARLARGDGPRARAARRRLTNRSRRAPHRGVVVRPRVTSGWNGVMISTSWCFGSCPCR